MDIVVVDCYEWYGVYKDGELVHEGDSLDFEQVLDALDIPVKYKKLSTKANNELMEIGELPRLLKDVRVKT